MQTPSTPAQRLRAAAAASWVRPKVAQPSVAALKNPVTGPVARQLMVTKLDLATHTSEGVTPAYLRSRERALLRELDHLTGELAAVRQQLAALPTT